MATLQKFVTRLLHHVEAFSFSADVSKSWLHTWGWLSELLLAKTAHFGVVLIAGLTDMVRLCFTEGAEIFLAFIASDPMVSHMLCCLYGNGVTIVIFLSFHNLSWSHLYNIST